jgi:hypothetical protein
MARTAVLLALAAAIVAFLPLAPGTSGKQSGTNSPLPQPQQEDRPTTQLVRLNATLGILPGEEPGGATGTGLSPAGERKATEPSRNQTLSRLTERAEGQTVRAMPATEDPTASFRSEFGQAPLQSWDQAKLQMERLGVKRFRLETWGSEGRFRFTCWVPVDGNPYITRQFEAVAETEFGAIQAALESIERWARDQQP